MNFSAFINVIKILAQLLPSIYALVKSLDGIAEAPGTGEGKLRLVLDLVKDAFADLKDIGVGWEQIEPYVRRVVERLLNLVRGVGG